MELFHDTFDGNDQNWSYTSTGARSYDRTWTEADTVKPGYKGVKLGSTSAVGSIRSEVFSLNNTSEDVSISIVAAAYSNTDGGKEGIAITVFNASGEHIFSDSVEGLKQHTSTGKVEIPATTDYTHSFTVPAADLPSSGGISLKIESTYTKSGQRRALIGDVLVSQATASSGGGDTPSGPTALATPTDLVALATSVNDSGFTLSWTGVENAAGYEVKVLDANDAEAGSVSISGTSATVTELVSDTAYTVHVKALAAEGSEEYSDSDWSDALSVTTALVGGLVRAEIFTEDFSTVEGATTWKSSSYLATITGDRGDWTGEAIAKGKNTAISIGKASDTGYVISPIVQLANGVSASTVEISFDAASYSGKKASVQVSVIDADTLETISVVGKNSPAALADNAESVADAGSSVVLSNVAVPARFRIRFDSLKDANDDYSRVWLDTILVTQVVNPNYATLDTPTVTVSDQTTEGFSASWEAVANATGGYEVEVLDGEGATAGNVQIDGLSATVTGLAAATQYTVRVRAIGDNLNFVPSVWGSAEAQTQALSYNVEFSISGFESGSSVYSGSEVSFVVTAMLSSNDGSSEEVTSQLTTSFADATFDSTTGAFSWTPSESDVGTAEIVFSVDVDGTTFSETVAVSVLSNWREVTLFSEGFSSWTTTWTGNSELSVPTTDTDNHLWTGSAEGLRRAHSALRLGLASFYNFATTPELFALTSKDASEDVTLRFKTASVKTNATLVVSVKSLSDGSDVMQESVTVQNLVSGSADIEGDDVEFSFAPPAGAFTVTFTADENGRNGRIGLDSVRLVQRVSAHSSANPLAAPANLSAQASSHSGFAVSWDAVDGAAGYEVRVYDEDGAALVPQPAVSVDAENCTATVSGLSPETKYYAKVRAVAQSGASTALTGSYSAAAASATTLRRPLSIAFF